MAVKKSLPLLLLLLLVAPGADAVPPPVAERAMPTMEERQKAFGEIDSLLTAGNKPEAADALLALTQDSSHAVFHAEAYARLATLLNDLSLPYSALIANNKALTLDAQMVSSAVVPAVEQAEKTGDLELLEDMLATNVAIEGDANTRGRIALLAARAAHRGGQYALAGAVLKLVGSDHSQYIEAKALEGVVLAMQGRHADALAPLLTAQSMASEAGRDAKLQNVLALNIGRAYFAMGNFPRAIEYYAQVERSSAYWPEAQFERAWSHFRLEDMNGTLALLQTLHSPFFADWYYPEADLLRIYSLFLMCKFPEASKEINAFQEHYKPVQQNLARIGARPGGELFDQIATHIDGKATDLPPMITRIYEDEERIKDNIRALEQAEIELRRLKGNPNAYAATATTWLTERRDALHASEGARIKARIQAMDAELTEMLNDSEISKLDILQMETRLYERAAQIGEMPDAHEVVRRDFRTRKGQVYWPWQGEYWADEAGYYKFSARPECPSGLTPGGR
jgi:tetratricopeptide (TPR) repeat protein